jgi:pimeloyl-ACP methyl ester carboxylesterase
LGGLAVYGQIAMDLSKVTVVSAPKSAAVMINLKPNSTSHKGTHPMNRPSDLTTEVLGYPTRYWQAGTGGNPLVLIHGISCSVLEWEHVIHGLAKRHQVYALDLLGHGLSAKPADASCDIATLAKFTLAFMDTMGLATASLGGNSLGARVALECAALAPERVTSLVLSAPAAVDKSTLFEFRLASVPFLGEIVTAPNPIGTGKIWRTAFADPSFATRELIAEKVALAKLPGAGKAFLKALRSMLNLGGFRPEVVNDTHDKLRRVKTPMLVIWGEQDRFLPISHLSTFKKLAPHAESVVINNCGHVPMIERAAEFNRLALEFLARR